MPTLSIHLQDGFEDDEVVILIDGEERERCSGVTTKLLYGLADTIELPASGKVAMEIRVRELSKTLEVDVTRDVFVGVSLQNGEIQTVVSVEPYGYA